MRAEGDRGGWNAKENGNRVVVAEEVVFQNGPRADWVEVRRDESEIYTGGIFGVGSVEESGGAYVDVEEVVIGAHGEELLSQVTGVFAAPDNVVTVEVAG